VATHRELVTVATHQGLDTVATHQGLDTVATHQELVTVAHMNYLYFDSYAWHDPTSPRKLLSTYDIEDTVTVYLSLRAARSIQSRPECGPLVGLNTAHSWLELCQ